MRAAIARKESRRRGPQARAGQARRSEAPCPALRRPVGPSSRPSTSWPRWWPWLRPTAVASWPTPTHGNTARACRAARCSAATLLDWLADPAPMRETLRRWRATQVATGRFDAQLRRAGCRPRRAAAGACHRQPDRPARARAGGDDRDRTADPAGPRGAHARPGAGQQGAGAQPGARDQEPAGRHPRRGATAGDGARDSNGAHRVHPASSSTRPTACRRWSTACWRRTAGRRWWPTSTSTRSASACVRWSLAEFPRGPAWSSATTTPRSPSSAATASS